MSEQLGLFGTDPWWLVVIKVLFIFVFLVVMTLFTIWFERRVVARMQHRLGPNRTGPFGLLQSLMDGMKLAFKAETIPDGVHMVVYWIAPVLSGALAFMTFAVIPFGGTVSIFGVETQLQMTDFPVSVLYALAISSIAIYGIVLAGWSSGSPYPLLGGLRSSAQMISYEISMGLSFVAVFLYAGSMATSEIVAAQEPMWFAVILLPSFLIYSTSMVGETNRAPFDLVEAESELVGGFNTEYSSMKFAMFFLGEYINMITVSAIAATLFLGGYLAPWPISLIPGANSGWWTMLWLLVKILLFLFIFIWLRGSLPRYRYDQFMRLGWKFLIPVSIGWIMIVATIRALRNQAELSTTGLLVGGAVIIGVLLVATWAWQSAADRKAVAREQAAQRRPYEPYAGGFPVPPLPGQQPVRSTRRREPGTTIVQEPTTTEETIDG